MSGRLLSMMVTLPAALQSPSGNVQPGVMAPPADTEARPGGGCVIYIHVGAESAGLGKGIGEEEDAPSPSPGMPLPLPGEADTLLELEDDGETLGEGEEEGETEAEGEGEGELEEDAVASPPPSSLSPVPFKPEPGEKPAEPETVGVTVLVCVVDGVVVMVAKLD